MRRLLVLQNEKGYTLLESLLHLVMFTAFVHLFILFFFWKMPIESHYSSMSNTAWEMFVVDMQAALIEVTEFTIYADNRGVQFKNKRGLIDIEQNNNVIRKKVDGLGHVPFLTDIYSAKFKSEYGNLVVDVTMRDGTRKERDFVVGVIP